MEEQTELPFFDSHDTIDVTVLQCRSMSTTSMWEKVLGAAEFFVQIGCTNAAGPVEFYTKTFARKKNILINETYSFVLTQQERKDSVSGQQRISIALFKNSTMLGQNFVDVSEFNLQEKYPVSLVFEKNQEVMKLEIEIVKSSVSKPGFRYSLGIPQDELRAVGRRKARVFDKMRQFVPETKSLSPEEVPTIAVACSGGGYRSAIQFCGAMEAMAESGLLDCVTYMAGLSGGSWYVLPAYAKEVFGNLDDLMDFHSEIKASAKSSLIVNAIADFSHYLKYRKYAGEKEREGQPVTFVDFYGFTLGRTFLGNQKLDVTLSDLRKYAGSGEVPIPIVTALHTRSKVSSAQFHADLEITPWEVSMPNYGINLPTEKFGSEWYKGSVVRSCPELPLHFFLGASSTAFGILLKYFLGGETTETDSKFISDIRKHEFGRYETKKKKKRSWKEKYETRRRRKRLSTVSMSSDGGNSEEVQRRQRRRSVTKISNICSLSVAGGENSSQNQADPAASTTRPLSCVSDYLTADEDEKDRLSDLQENDSAFVLAKDHVEPRVSAMMQFGDVAIEQSEIGPPKRGAYWKKIVKKISQHPLFTDREAVIDRTAKTLNFARGISSIRRFHLNPEHRSPETESQEKQISAEEEYLAFVDAAVINNIPTNALLRPHRKTDILIVCDATEYKSDTDIDYLELFIAERLAREQGLKFPSIDPQKLKDDPRGVVHVFEDKKDPECPIVIWFTLCNKEFKLSKNAQRPKRRQKDDDYKIPSDEKFNEFPVFGPQSCYATLNTRFTPLQFDRLKELMKHSFASNMEMIKRQIHKKISQKKKILE